MMNPNDPKYKGRHKTYRKKHPKMRNKFRADNYKKSRPEVRKNIPWSEEDLRKLKYYSSNPRWSDAYISKEMNRSVQAIQQKRYLLRKVKI